MSSKRNEAKEAFLPLVTQAMKMDPKVSTIVKMGHVIAEMLLKEAIRLMHNGTSEGLHDAADRTRIASEVLTFVFRLQCVFVLTQDEVVRLLRNIAKEKRGVDRRNLDKVASLLKRGDIANSWKKLRSLDTLVRESVPAAPYHWLEHRSGKKNRESAVSHILMADVMLYQRTDGRGHRYPQPGDEK